MTDAPLDPEQVAEIRDELGQHSGWSEPMATAGYPVGRVRALCDTVEHLRERLERYEELLRSDLLLEAVEAYEDEWQSIVDARRGDDDRANRKHDRLVALIRELDDCRDALQAIGEAPDE